jgi:hypothetical protein
MEDHENLEKFIEEAKGRQRNIVFPDTVRNERAALVFLWNGSAKPPVVQRMAACLFGLCFLANGLMFLAMAVSAHNGDSWILAPLSLPFIFVTTRRLLRCPHIEYICMGVN